MRQRILRMDRLTMSSLALAIALVSVPALQAQQSKPAPTPPVPAQVLTGRKVFISNAGVDSTSLAAFKQVGDPDLPYNQFYASMKSWGQYELVAAPADADLVFEIRFTAPLTGCETITAHEPQLDLVIWDAKTHFKLWTFTEPVHDAFRKATLVKNLRQAIANLVDGLRKLTTQPAT
jgi:hypothetical protein